MSREEVGRGTAFGDIDNDGDIDIVVSNNGGFARLLLNAGKGRSSPSCWTGVRVLDRSGRRDALGVMVTAFSEDVTQNRRSATDGSYASASDSRVLFQCTTSGPITAVQVEWSETEADCWHALPSNSYVTLRYGSGANRTGGRCHQALRRESTLKTTTTESRSRPPLLDWELSR